MITKTGLVKGINVAISVANVDSREFELFTEAYYGCLENRKSLGTHSISYSKAEQRITLYSHFEPSVTEGSAIDEVKRELYIISQNFKVKYPTKNDFIIVENDRDGYWC